MTDIYSKKCKNAFWPLFAPAALSAVYAPWWPPTRCTRWLEGQGRCVCALWGSTCRNSGNQRSKSLKKIQHGKAAEVGCFFWSILQELVIDSPFLCWGLLPFQCLPPGKWALQAFWFLYVSCISIRKRQIFSLPLHSPKLILFQSVQQLKEFLKRLNTAGLNLTQVRYHPGKKITSSPSNWKAHINKKYIYVSDYKKHYLIKQIIKLIKCGSKIFIFVHISGLKEKV